MTSIEKSELIELINRLATKRLNESQYDPGQPYIDEKGIRILKNFIRGYGNDE